MIAKLSGIRDSAGPDGVVIDVGGVGYLVFCSARTLRQLPAEGEALRLVIETHVREDHIHLYGFVDEAERGIYRLLTTVQGVGAKLALAILGALSPDALVAAIAAQDRTALTQADGVGPKLATRIVVELRDKIGGLPAAGRGCRGRCRRLTARRPTRFRRWSISATAGSMPSGRSLRRRARSPASPISTR